MTLRELYAELWRKTLYILFVAASILSTPIYISTRLLGRDSWLKMIRASYNHFSPHYDRLAGLLPGYTGLVDRVVSKASPRGLVLDVGCGTGLATTRLALKGVEAVGVDLSRSQLRAARSKTVGLAVHLVECDAAKLPFRRNVFDRVVSTGALSEMGAPLAVLREAVRVLRPDGLLVFGVYGRIREAALNPWGFTRRGLEDTALRAGLRGVTISYVRPYYLILSGWKPRGER